MSDPTGGPFALDGPWWSRIAVQFGALGILGFIAWAGWDIVRNHLDDNSAMHARDSEYNARLSTAMEQQAAATARIADALEQLADSVDTTRREVEDLTEAVQNVERTIAMRNATLEALVDMLNRERMQAPK